MWVGNSNLLHVCLAKETWVRQARAMHGRRFALLLLAAVGSACNDGEDDQAPADTCSAENIVDDIDDGVDDEATGAQAAPTDLSY